MARKHTKKGRKSKKKKLLNSLFSGGLPIFLIIILLFSAGAYFYEGNEIFRDFVSSIIDVRDVKSEKPYIDPNGEEMALHFIDVGQGDSTLLQSPKGNVLIDCGEKEYGDDVIKYLKNQGINELEYFIITHPDSDHMGCAAYVLENIKVNNFVINGKEKSAVFFENALDVIENKGINAKIAEDGDVYLIGNLRLEILGPSVYDIDELDSNDSSLIIYATYGSKAFLFTGDAEVEGEKLLLQNHESEIDCDIFSAGHHGAKTSNSLALLEAASPEYVVVSCGKGNSYGHPTSFALNNFSKVGATVLRTDELGTIVFITDGSTITVK
jgi:competence protein ComEC